MHFKLPLVSLVGLASIASAAVLPADELDLLVDRQVPTGPCATGVHVIAAPGEGNPEGSLSLLGSLTSDVVNAIPGSDYAQLPYPIPQNSTDGERITIIGSRMLRRYMRRYHRACPDTQFVLLGYSAGGVIVMNTLCGQSAPYPVTNPILPHWPKSILASVVYGDQTRLAGQPYNEGTCIVGSGRFPRSNTTGCIPYENNIQSFCDSGDPQCCTGGTDPNDHFVYATEYDITAMNWVVGKWQAYQASL